MTRARAPRTPLIDRRVHAPRARRRGTALLAVLAALVIAMIVATAAAALGRALQDDARGAAASLRARAAAEGGLAMVLTTWPAAWTALATGASDVRTVSSTAGTASVRALRLDVSRYLLAAEAASAAGPGSIGPAVRRVGVFAQLENIVFSPPAALVAAGPVSLATDIDVRGADAPPPTWTDCDATVESPTAAAIAAPSVRTVVGTRVAGTVLTAASTWTPPTPERFGDIDRDALVARADIVLAPGNYTPIPRAGTGTDTACIRDRLSWGEPLHGPTAVARCTGDFPVIHIRGAGTTTLFGPARFQGTLIVDGSLDLFGRIDAAGLILVNGPVQTRAFGSLVLDGALVSRGTGATLAAGSRVRRSRCALDRAAAAVSRPSPLARRAWVDLVR